MHILFLARKGELSIEEVSRGFLVIAGAKFGAKS